MHDDRALVAAGSIADPAVVAVPFEHLFPQSTEVLFILPLQRVAGRTQALGQNFVVPAPAMQYLLQVPLQWPSPASEVALSGYQAIHPPLSPGHN